MSTNSLIGIKNKDGNVKAVYSHSDGYYKHNGLILYTFYNSKDKVEELVNLGDMSRLGLFIGEKYDFYRSYKDLDYYNKFKNQCVFYSRDRDENLNICNDNFSNIISKHSLTYNYIYFEDKEEWVAFKYKENEFSSLEDILKTDDDISDGNFQKKILMDKELDIYYKAKIIETFIKLDVLNIDQNEYESELNEVLDYYSESLKNIIDESEYDDISTDRKKYLDNLYFDFDFALSKLKSYMEEKDSNKEDHEL